jgi:hypothetical protein
MIGLSPIEKGRHILYKYVRKEAMSVTELESGSDQVNLTPGRKCLTITTSTSHS